jgi:hypothetical protein
VDLSEREVLNLAFLAHIGFEKMIGREGPKREFDDEQDAERASEAIRQLERHKPKDAVDESDPYAQAFNRQTMIWDRWPTKTAERGLTTGRSQRQRIGAIPEMRVERRLAAE